MPPKRGASSGLGPSTSAKTAKSDGRPGLMDIVALLRNNPDEEDIEDACDQLHRIAMERSEERLSGGLERDAAIEEAKEWQQKHAALERELKDTRKGWDDYKTDIKQLIRDLRSDATEGHNESQRKSHYIDEAREMADGLAKEVKAWEEATTTLQSVMSEGGEDGNITDCHVAQRAVDRYERRVKQSAEKLCDHLSPVETVELD
ncbi:hypothetical protein PG985_013679 [Apiospora marii]|uniref:Uncharacterized protein n=1 Tax=Apiospora marii TaxID=335849 RepID=A0ABR1R7G7_9PEZI